MNLGSHINEYRTGVARFQYAVCHHRSVRRHRFDPMSLFFAAQDAYSRSFCEFFSVAKVNSFLPARRYASAGLCDSDVSVCPSVRPSVRRTPVLCLAERKQDREMYTD